MSNSVSHVSNSTTNYLTSQASLFNSSTSVWSLAALCLILYISHDLWVRSPNTSPIDNTSKRPLPLVGGPSTLPWLLPRLRSQYSSFVYARDWAEQGWSRFGAYDNPYQVQTWSEAITLLPFKYTTEIKNMSEGVMLDQNVNVRLVYYASVIMV